MNLILKKNIHYITLLIFYFATKHSSVRTIAFILYYIIHYIIWLITIHCIMSYQTWLSVVSLFIIGCFLIDINLHKILSKYALNNQVMHNICNYYFMSIKPVPFSMTLPWEDEWWKRKKNVHLFAYIKAKKKSMLNLESLASNLTVELCTSYFSTIMIF